MIDEYQIGQTIERAIDNYFRRITSGSYYGDSGYAPIARSIQEIEKNLMSLYHNVHNMTTSKYKAYVGSKFAVNLYTINYIVLKDDILVMHIVDKEVSYMYDTKELAAKEHKEIVDSLRTLS